MGAFGRTVIITAGNANGFRATGDDGKAYDDDVRATAGALKLHDDASRNGKATHDNAPGTPPNQSQVFAHGVVVGIDALVQALNHPFIALINGIHLLKN